MHVLGHCTMDIAKLFTEAATEEGRKPVEGKASALWLSLSGTIIMAPDT